MPELMMHWNLAYSLALRDARPEDSIVARYEDLVSDPLSTLERLGDFLGLEKREVAEVPEEKYRELRNTNEKYFAEHTLATYGQGVWDEFDYKA